MGNFNQRNSDNEITILRKTIAEQQDEILQLKNILTNVPGDVYWKNKEGVWLGFNTTASESLHKMGFPWKTSDVIGKTDYDLFKKETADEFRKNDLDVMQNGIVLTREEEAILPSGEKIVQLSTKRPLLNKNDEIVGIIGITINITAEKEVSRLKLENEVQKQSLEDQKKFTKIANQVAHDIRSPLSSLLMVIKSCAEIPEPERIALREAAISIGDIANSLLSRYQATDTLPERAERQPLLVSATLMQLLTDKKYEYPRASWTYEVNSAGHFAFIIIAPSDFKRAISNLINNAVEACDRHSAHITVQIHADNEWLNILIQDNGKGMTPAVIDKIKQQIAITGEKKSGHGIGLMQVRETLQRHQGELAFDSAVEQGTTVTLTFPRIKAPAWIAEIIPLKPHDTIVILDDDTSIHGAWDRHFQSAFTQASHITLKHFSVGQQALDFILGLSPQEKQHVLLLTDYELLKQDLDGLTVIEKSGIERSILVTSHYANPVVRERAAKVGSKILPKPMASEIQIQIDDMTPDELFTSPLKKVDFILVDDDQSFAKNLMMFVFDNLRIDYYHDPHYFLSNIKKYGKETKILLDNQFANGSLSGIQLAQQLYARGYTQLYLLSGQEFEKNQLPKYLTIIRKDDIDSIKRMTQI